jgi:hypothetical protein
MPSKLRERLQNRRPAALVQSRKDLADRNLTAVRTTVQAMQRRGLLRHEITPVAVAREAGISRQTIYRREELFAIIHRANPTVQRRSGSQRQVEQLAALARERDAAREEAAYHRKTAGLAELDDRRAQAQVVQLKRQVLQLQAEVTRLRERMAACTCGGSGEPGPRVHS